MEPQPNQNDQMPDLQPNFPANPSPSHNPSRLRRVIALFAVALALLMAGVFLYALKAGNAIPAPDAPQKAVFIPAAMDPNIPIEARAAFVYDLKDRKVLFAKSPDDILPLASLTKIMTAYVARGLYPATTTVTIARRDLAADGDSGLYANERWTLGSLLRLTLISSSNDGASAIAAIGRGATSSPIFLDLMNAEAARLGFSDMHFLNESGLDIDLRTSGGYGSARQVSMLLAEGLARFPDTFEATAEEKERLISESGLAHSIKNTNTSLGEIPGIIASKTGFTDIAGGNLAVIFDAGLGHPIAVTVLGSSEEGRFSDVVALCQRALQTLSGTTTPQR